MNLFLTFFLLLILTVSAEARESFNFTVGEKIHILSDKAYRKTKGNQFEAVGNVIITHMDKALYGEKASITFDTGDVEVMGNVRYVGPQMTLYGSQLYYNFKTNFLSVYNARVLSDNYTVLGKKLSRIDKNTLIGEDAEYTTCRDCPESWTIFGKKVHITLGEYVRIKHAFIKVNGVIVMYFPYIIFPIKKQRESGLLFPKFGVDFDEGVRFQQPWYWAINNSKDLTTTPSFFGKRGFGHEFEYRHIFGERKWLEFDSIQVYDRIYQPDKANDEVSGDHFFRYFTNYEHNYSVGHNFNHHLFFSQTKDLDVVRDYRDFSEEYLQGSEIGGGTFLDYRMNHFVFSAESFWNQNQLISDPRTFDDRYVQLVPKLTLQMTPVSFLQTETLFFKNMALSFRGDYSVFRQNKANESAYIRNAKRVSARPSFNWQLGSFGPVNVRHETSYDYQDYRFPEQSIAKTFSKAATIFTSEMSLEVDKIYGLAYRENIPMESIDHQKLSELTDVEKNDVPENKPKSHLIGELPSFEKGLSKDYYELVKNSYKHSQVFKLRHIQTADSKIRGNSSFWSQIKTSDGLFDHYDILQGRESEIAHSTSKTIIPTTNTIEFQWNNSVVRKSPHTFDPYQNERYLRDNFSYHRVSHFNLSQGYVLDETSGNFEDKLTRLHVNSGITLDKFQIGFNEYFFYVANKHITNLTLSRSFDWGRLQTIFTYDSFVVPVDKDLALIAQITPIDLISLGVRYDYDIEKKESTEATYNVLYSPYNNCWKLDVSYRTTEEDEQISFNFLVNFNENIFTSITGS